MHEDSGVHHSHAEVLKRLRRAHGHLGAVISMVEKSRPCVETAQQLHAVVKAVENAKRLFVQDHIDHCITAGSDGSSGTVEAIQELKEITKYL